MKISLKLTNRITCEAEAKTQLEIFEQLSAMNEVFGEEKCGKCGGEKINFRIRHVVDGKKEFTYPEMTCQEPKCWAKLAFGQMEGGGLFPIRYQRVDGEYVKDKDGKNIPKGVNGWTRYNFDKKMEE